MSKNSFLRQGALTLAFTTALSGAPLVTPNPLQTHTDNNHIPKKVDLWPYGTKYGLMLRMEGHTRYFEGANTLKQMARVQARQQRLLAINSNALLMASFMQRFDHVKTASLSEKIEAVNKEVNTMLTWTKDQKLYGQSDYWAAPIQTLRHGRGDCEDFALLKYAILRALNVPDSRVYVTLVNDNGSSDSINHSMVIVNISDDDEAPRFIALDNEYDQPHEVASSIYSFYNLFNDSGAWEWAPKPRTAVKKTP